MATKTKTVRNNSPRRKAPTAEPIAAKEVVKKTEQLTKEEAINLLSSVIKKVPKAGLPLKAPNTNLTSELNNIDFRKMIGGPLQAVVDAQVAASLATINFINEVGFTKPTDPATPRELVMVDFTHTRKDVKADGTADDKVINIKIPLLAMLPIPSLRIEHVIIDFNVKLNSVETSTVSTDIGVNAEVKGGWGPVSFKVSASYQRKSTTGVEVKKEYALNINVKAVQDEIPAGLEKILNMLAA
ncbi:MAG: DUF2589 domain-containing protein [Saprospiraceae bacterium]